jgi:hypothetical protein
VINLEDFSVGADCDGQMTLDHDVTGCYSSADLRGKDHFPTIARMIELAEEHLKVCPLRVIEL